VQLDEVGLLALLVKRVVQAQQVQLDHPVGMVPQVKQDKGATLVVLAQLVAQELLDPLDLLVLLVSVEMMAQLVKLDERVQLVPQVLEVPLGQLASQVDRDKQDQPDLLVLQDKLVLLVQLAHLVPQDQLGQVVLVVKREEVVLLAHQEDQV
jgi:hypothetical protein